MTKKFDQSKMTIVVKKALERAIAFLDDHQLGVKEKEDKKEYQTLLDVIENNMDVRLSSRDY